jgi:predicted protein tyrosine phosphatase
MSSHEIEIEVVSRVEAGEILCSSDLCDEVAYLVSIGDGDDPLPNGYENVDQKLRLLIADVVGDEGATENDIKQIISLAEQLKSRSGKVLVHCEAGVSRSTAVALIIYARWLGRGREPEAMRRVIRQRPQALPNQRMVRLADQLLQLDGRLLEARDTYVFSLSFDSRTLE